MKRKNKTQRRALWLMEHWPAIEAAADEYRHYKGVRNAKYDQEHMSGGGWGFWVRAAAAMGDHFKRVFHPMNYWTGKLPTPSTAINRGVAEYIQEHAPKELK